MLLATGLGDDTPRNEMWGTLLRALTPSAGSQVECTAFVVSAIVVVIYLSKEQALVLFPSLFKDSLERRLISAAARVWERLQGTKIMHQLIKPLSYKGYMPLTRDRSGAVLVLPSPRVIPTKCYRASSNQHGSSLAHHSLITGCSRWYLHCSDTTKCFISSGTWDITLKAGSPELGTLNCRTKN